MKQFKPMLAASLVSPRDTEDTLDKSLSEVYYPVLATPKLDGIRCVTLPREPGQEGSNVLCRSLKPVPNKHINKLLSVLPPGLDGEILTYGHWDLFQASICRKFNDVQSDVMCHQGNPNFKYHVFDCNILDEEMNYSDRVKLLEDMPLPDTCVKVLPNICRNSYELQQYMSAALQSGHEGICYRTSLHCPYKYGRATMRQQWLVKWKLFSTSEAVIVGFEEEMHNANVAKINELGYLVRASDIGNQVGKGRLGSLICTMAIDRHDQSQWFSVGTGFTQWMREEYWATREKLLGKLVTFRHQPFGAKEKPRLPIFVGIRHEDDTSK